MIIIEVIVAMKHLYPVEGFSGLLQCYKTLRLEIGLTDCVCCFGIVGSDARACTKELIAEICDRKKLNRNPSTSLLLTSSFFLLALFLPDFACKNLSFQDTIYIYGALRIQSCAIV